MEISSNIKVNIDSVASLEKLLSACTRAVAVITASFKRESNRVLNEALTWRDSISSEAEDFSVVHLIVDDDGNDGNTETPEEHSQNAQEFLMLSK